MVLNYIFDIPLDQPIDWLERPGLLIIDEAQGSYLYGKFWNDYIKNITPTHAPMVILFSSWGSASGRSGVKTPTPIYLKAEQGISIRASHASEPSVFFRHSEFLDVVERLKTRHGQAFLPDKDVVAYIWDLTNGHTSAVRLIWTSSLNLMLVSRQTLMQLSL